MASRYFVADRSAKLDPAVAHHLRTVMRLRVDDEAWLFDGSGAEARIRIRALPPRRGLEFELVERRQVPAPPAPLVEVAFSPPNDAQRVAQILEHGCELGVRRFRPVIFERSKEAVRRGLRLDRWQRIVQAAAGQCGRSHLPELHEAESFAAWLARQRAEAATGEFAHIVAEHALRWPGACATATSCARADTLRVAVGPEGGMTDGERSALAQAGYAALSIGDATLRVETAVLSAVAVLRVWRDEAPR